MHVVAVNETLLGGWIPDDQLAAQMDVLNENFAPNHIKFVLQGITRTVNPAWSTDAAGAELQMKSALRKGDYKTLNLYFQKRLMQNALGYAYYPTTTTVGSRAFNLSGATNRYDTVPGGTATNYNLGKTVTHEVGHWMGLAHTFDGYSCDGPGDYIADTAVHNEPTSGCPIGLDSCIDDEGPDPIHNYMDYSYDSCYEEFTALQTKRMFDMWYYYRDPRPCNADNCLRALRSSSVPGRLEESQEFCEEFTTFLVKEVSLVKPYAASACSGNVISRVSSACSCLPTPTA
ncbi:zincin [Cadophora sp. DSE1049]|nr:zincin [Cadophora sp. DSE1049]